MQDLFHKNLRFRGYDYNQNGYYFITVCVKNMECILSEVVEKNPESRDFSSEIVAGDDLGAPYIHLTNYGDIVKSNILKMNDIYNEICVEKFVIMPNHVHLLIYVSGGSQRAPGSSPATGAVPRFIAAFKKFTNKASDRELWQRNYYDHIIRDEPDLLNHIQYINENPKKWLLGKDKYYT